MSNSTEESDRKILSKDQIDSPSIDEESCEGSISGGGGIGMKKGPWTAGEDAILIDYVKKHGEGNWNAVQKHSGLFRCGKSCRLRWANHLRPNLKKGAFTQEEERVIVELHAKIGNKWARMAGTLPGRTDNEIKNYWNTRVKRRQRAGLPLYPPDVQARVSEDNQSQSIGDFSAGDEQHNEVLQGNAYGIPDVFEDYKNNTGALYCGGQPFPDISLSNMLSQGFGSQSYGLINPSVNNKRLRELESFFPGSFGSSSVFENFPNDPSEKITRPFALGYGYDPDFTIKSSVGYGGPISGSHGQINGNFSASRTIFSPVKLELPSLQDYETNIGSWFPSLLSPPETFDSYTHSPLETVSLQSECTSPRNSGLLEDLLHESLKKQSADKSSNSSEMTPNEMVDSSAFDVCETGWDGYNDPTSPLGCSAASVFNESTPPISGGSLDDFLSSQGHSAGLETMVQSAEHISYPNAMEMDDKPRPDFFRPDALLGSASWLLENSQTTKEHNDMNNAIAALLGDSLSSEYNQVPAETSTCSQGVDLDSYPWNNMPRVCQMSEDSELP